MSRNLSANTLAATTAAAVFPVIFVEVSLASGPLRMHSGYGPLTLLGNTFQGVGQVLGVGDVEEGLDLASHGLSITLAGLDPALLATILSQHYQGRSVRVWAAFYSGDNTGTLLADPFEFFTGRLDTVTVTEDAQTLNIAANAESELVDLKRSRELRYTEATMTGYNPTDRGFQYVASIENRTINWGKVYRAGEKRYMDGYAAGSGYTPSYSTAIQGIRG